MTATLTENIDVAFADARRATVAKYAELSGSDDPADADRLVEVAAKLGMTPAQVKDGIHEWGEERRDQKALATVTPEEIRRVTLEGLAAGEKMKESRRVADEDTAAWMTCMAAINGLRELESRTRDRMRARRINHPLAFGIDPEAQQPAANDPGDGVPSGLVPRAGYFTIPNPTARLGYE